MNELIIVKDIEKRLQKQSEVKVFPLTPTHRKELRELRDTNIGHLRTRLNAIKQIKKDEYTKKYQKQIQSELKKNQKLAKELNDEWEIIVKNIKSMIASRKAYEDELNNKLVTFDLQRDYADISTLDTESKQYKRIYSVNISTQSKKIASQEFDEKYGESFKKAGEEIDRLYQMYEEAINFGDLDIVKEIYYKLKDADSFFDRVSSLKI